MEERAIIEFYYEKHNEWCIKAYESYLNFIKMGFAEPPQYQRLNLDQLRQLKVNSVRRKLTLKNLEYATKVCLNGVIHLDISSSLCGRTQGGASDIFDSFYDNGFEDDYTDEFILWSEIYCQTPGKEEASFSDFATDKAHKLLMKLLQSEIPTHRYIYIDQLIHLTHWNGDLTYLFVHGGDTTLNKL